MNQGLKTNIKQNK